MKRQEVAECWRKMATDFHKEPWFWVSDSRKQVHTFVGTRPASWPSRTVWDSSSGSMYLGDARDSRHWALAITSVQISLRSAGPLRHHCVHPLEHYHGSRPMMNLKIETTCRMSTASSTFCFLRRKILRFHCGLLPGCTPAKVICKLSAPEEGPS